MKLIKRNYFTIFALILSVLIMQGVSNAEKLRALYGDGSVRYTSVGPFGLSNSQNALIGLLLPAVQKAQASIHIIDNNGKVLKTIAKDIPTDQIPTDQKTSGFWQISLKLSVDDSGAVMLTDGTATENIGDIKTSEHVSILIGLLLPAVQKVREAAARMHTGSVQITNKRTGDIVSILPFIEQSVLAKTLNFTKGN